MLSASDLGPSKRPRQGLFPVALLMWSGANQTATGFPLATLRVEVEGAASSTLALQWFLLSSFSASSRERHDMVSDRPASTFTLVTL